MIFLLDIECPECGELVEVEFEGFLDSENLTLVQREPMVSLCGFEWEARR